jgi:hypothetical protein
VSFVDGKGPPPYDFFDQWQDHAAAFAGAIAGRSHSLDSDEFTEAWFRSGYFGRMFIERNTGASITAAPGSTPGQVGIHGAGSALGGLGSFSFAVGGGLHNLAADFLLTAKVKIVAPQSLDSANALGFCVAIGDPLLGSPRPPGFVAGGDTATWRVLYAVDGLSGTIIYDTGIPCLPDVWYRLQISRVNGAVRWFINGQICAFRYPFPPTITFFGTAAGGIVTIRAAGTTKRVAIAPGTTAANAAIALAAALTGDPAFPLTGTSAMTAVACLWRGLTGPVSITTDDASQQCVLTFQQVPYIEGMYYPYALPAARKWLEMTRSVTGTANEGVYVDSFHLLAQRTTP